MFQKLDRNRADEEDVYRQLECLRLPARNPETLGVIAAGHVWNKPSEADNLKEK
ncbi:hypothetical protein PO124_30580 [Bacillus licheniformis]|nr:hypothetical protein [Bacillus licheniformis]